MGAHTVGDWAGGEIDSAARLHNPTAAKESPGGPIVSTRTRTTNKVRSSIWATWRPWVELNWAEEEGDRKSMHGEITADMLTPQSSGDYTVAGGWITVLVRRAGQGPIPTDKEAQGII
ncbi:hypothetical protein PC121_g19623 [Phytophthora cactorum]|nr:hypothetical protein PC120_g21032 [Phytophthora cactorum]KAG3048232.1 hypothetical protein PC121_g19623 [Phytophthora cactorum]